MRPPRQHSQPREAGARGTTGALFGRLEQEDQRLKKHYCHWMDIVRSLDLESCILTKLTKPSVPVNLVGPQVSLPLYWVPANRGSIHFFLCVVRRHFLACEDIAGGSDLIARGTFFCKIQKPFWWVPDVRWRNHYFVRNKEAFPYARPWTLLSASPRTVHVRWMSFVHHVDHAAPRAPGRWTTARPRKGTTGSRGRRGSGSPRGEEYEGSLVRLRCEAAVAAGPGQRWA